MTKLCSCCKKRLRPGFCDCWKTPGEECSTCQTRVCDDCYNHKEKLCNTCLENRRASATGRSASGRRPTDDAREPQSSSSGTLRGRAKAPEYTEIDNLSEVQVDVENNQDDGGNRNQEEVPDRAERPKASAQKDPGTEITPTPAASQLFATDDQSEQKEHTKTFIQQEEPAEEDPGTGESLINRELPVQKQERSSNEEPGRSSAQHRASGQNSYPQDSDLAVINKANNALPETNKTPPEVSKVDNVQDTTATEQKFQYQSTINSTSGHTPQSSVTPFQQEKHNEVKPEIKDGTHQPVLPVPISKKEWFLGGTTSSNVTKPDHGLPKNMADILPPEVTKLDNHTEISKVDVPPPVAQMDNFQKTPDTIQGIQHLPKEILTPGHHTQLVSSEGLLDLKELEPGSKGHSNLNLPVQKSEKKVHESLEKSAGLSRTSVPNSDSRDKGSPEMKKVVQATLPEDSRMGSVQADTGVKVSIPYQSIAIRVSRHSQEMQGGQQKLPRDMTIKEIKAFLESRGKKVAKGDEKWALVEMVQKIQEQESRGCSTPEQRPTSGKLSDAGHNPVSTAQTEDQGKTANPEHQTTRPPETQPQTPAVTKVQTQEETKGQHQEDQGHKKVASKMSVDNSDPVSSTEPKDLMDTPSVQDSKDSMMDQSSEVQQAIRPSETQPQTQAVTKVQTQEETKGQHQEDQGNKREVASKMSVVNSDPVSSTEPKDLMDTPLVPESKDSKMDQSSEELTVVDIREMTVRQLKDFLQKRGIHVIGGVEKSDLVQQVTEIERKGDNQGTGSKQLAQDAPSEVPTLKEETQFRTQQDHSEEQIDMASSSSDDDEIGSDSTEEDERETSEMVKPGLTEGNPDRMDQDPRHVPHQHGIHRQNEGFVLADLFTKYEIKSISDILHQTRPHLQEILDSQGVQAGSPMKTENLVKAVQNLWEKMEVWKRANEQRRSLDGDLPSVDTSMTHSWENSESKDATKSPQQMSDERPETEGQTGENNEEVGRQHENIEAANQGHTEPRDLSKIGSLSDIRSELEIDQLGVRQLKTLLLKHAVRQDGIQEKSEMVSKVKQLWHDVMTRIRRDIPPEDLCRICMSEFIDCLLLECGHSVTCITCGRKIQECPMCRQYISSEVHLFQLETEQGSDPVCLICKRNQRNSALLPCGHVATCYDCGYAITHCPQCQEYIRKPVRMYKS